MATTHEDRQMHSQPTLDVEKVDSGEKSETLSSSQEPKDNEVPNSPHKIGNLRRAVVAVSTISAIFLYAVDDTIVADIQPSIIHSLQEIPKLPWISVAFRLGATCTNLIWGQVYAEFNVKILYIISVSCFEIGSAICGAAPTMNVLIGGRLLCGIGGMGIYLGALNIISTLTPIRTRAMWLSFISLSHCAGILLGPVIGGAFSDSRATWRWAFYINLCFAAVLAPAYIFALPSYSMDREITVFERIKKLDFVGTALYVGGFVALLLPLTFGGILWPWNSGKTIGTLACAGALLVAFGLQQFFLLLTNKKHQLFPVFLLVDYEQWLFFIQTVSATASTFVPLYFIPLYFQFVRGDDALKAGVRLLPFVAVLAVCSFANGALMGKLGYYFPWYVIGSILVIVGSALLRTVTPSSSDSLVYGYSVVLGAGTGCFTQASFAAAQTRITPDKIPGVLAFLGCGQLIGMSLNFVVSYSIFFNLAYGRIAAVLPGISRQNVEVAIEGVGGSFLASLSDNSRDAVLEAIAASISDVYDMILATGVLSLVVALFMRKDKAFK